MSTIVLRSVKGTPLTNQEVDDNFNNLNTDKLQLGGTYSSGTANGVPYLNGSKVLTTGSALTFDGTNFVLASGGLLDIDSTNAAVAMRIRQTTAGAGTEFNTTITENTGVTFDCTDGGVNARSFIWTQAGAEQMRLTSTGLGIGTSSPAYKLDVSATGTTVSSAFRSDQSQMWVMLKDSGTALGNVRIGSEAGSFIAYANGNQLVYNSSGNLGLGVTPSAWGAGWKALEVGPNAATAFIMGGGDDSIFGNSCRTTNGSAWYYTYTGVAPTKFRQQGGRFEWFTAPSGTAGNAISFTQAMTLNAAGNLLLGSTTAPAGFARVSLVGGESSGSGANSGIQLTYNASTFGGGAITTVNAAGGGMSFYTFTGNVGSESYTERARITSGGNLLVNMTTPSYGAKLAVNGTIETYGTQFNIAAGSALNFEWVLREGAAQAFYVNNASVVATLSSSGVWTDASDARYKENIRPITYGLAEVLQLQPRAYNIIGSEKQEIGFVAQEVEPVLPELVESSRNSITEEDRLTLSYGQMSAVLVKAIQEQQAIITALTARVAALESN